MEFFRNDWQFVCASVEEVVKKRYWEKSIFILFQTSIHIGLYCRNTVYSVNIENYFLVLPEPSFERKTIIIDLIYIISFEIRDFRAANSMI